MATPPAENIDGRCSLSTAAASPKPLDRAAPAPRSRRIGTMPRTRRAPLERRAARGRHRPGTCGPRPTTQPPISLSRAPAVDAGAQELLALVEVEAVDAMAALDIDVASSPAGNAYSANRVVPYTRWPRRPR